MLIAFGFRLKLSLKEVPWRRLCERQHLLLRWECRKIHGKGIEWAMGSLVESHAGVENAWFSMGGKGKHHLLGGMETLDMSPMFGMRNPPAPFRPCSPPFHLVTVFLVAFPHMPDWWMSHGYGGKGQGNPGELKKGKNKKVRRRREMEEEESRDSEEEKRSRSGNSRGLSGGPGDGGGPPGSTPTDPPDPDQDSPVDTSAIRSMLKGRVKQNMDRPKSSLGSVKIEEFAGERSRYAKWKKAVEAQQQLYRLDEEELAMLIYLSSRCEDENEEDLEGDEAAYRTYLQEVREDGCDTILEDPDQEGEEEFTEDDEHEVLEAYADGSRRPQLQLRQDLWPRRSKVQPVLFVDNEDIGRGTCSVPMW